VKKKHNFTSPYLKGGTGVFKRKLEKGHGAPATERRRFLLLLPGGRKNLVGGRLLKWEFVYLLLL